MEVLQMLANGFDTCLTPANLLACTAGIIIGTIVGVLPGIGPVGTIALLLPLSMSMDAVSSIIMLSGIYYGAMYGGSTTSILLNIPGEASSMVTCIDGYAMAKKGRGGAALAIAAIGSFIAGTIGLAGLTLFAPLLSDCALYFGPAEYCAIAVLGLLILTKLTGNSMTKSILMVLIGVMLGTVGLDSLSGISRFSFNIDELQRGVEFSVLIMGLFGISEIIDTMISPVSKISLQKVRFRELYPTKEEWNKSVGPIFRGGVIGFLAGLLPGPAATISTFVSYVLEKRRSKYPEQFGQGAIEGVAGPEAANNAAASATMIPLMSLGLPFSPAAAILLSGFMLHGVIPGPTLVDDQPVLFWGLIASMYIGNVLLLVVNLPLVGIFANILKTPVNILMPVILAITMAGAYSINNSIFDLWLLILFGLLGFFMKRTGYEPAPMVIGMILGPILERGLVQGLIIGNGSLLYFVARPISGTILAAAALIIIYSLVRWLIKKNRRQVLRGEA